MANGRIATYVHSDSTTENKGAAMVRVTTETDFAARTDEFKKFAQDAAMYTYGALSHTRAFIAGPDMWNMIITQFPRLEDDRKMLERELRESVRVSEIVILRL